MFAILKYTFHHSWETSTGHSISQVFINYSVYISIILMWEKHFFEVIHWSPWILKSLFSVVCFTRLFTVLILCFICLGKLSPTLVGKIKIETCSVTYCSLWGDFSFLSISSTDRIVSECWVYALCEGFSSDLPPSSLKSTPLNRPRQMTVFMHPQGKHLF